MDDIYIVFGKAYLFLIAYKTIFILSILVIAIFFISSFRHHRKVSDYLYQKIPFTKDDLKKLKPKIGTMEMTVSGIAIFDVLYHLSKVNPLLLSGAYRLHHKSEQFESYSDISAYLKHQYALNSERAVHKYKGYVGEEHTIGQQIESGADITVPDSGANPGYDFIIDGQKYDRKVVGDTNLNEEIKDLKDDEKLWVGTDSGRDYLDNDKVYVDQNSLSEVEYSKITSDSFEGMVNVGDFIDGIPLITLAFSSAKNYKLVKSGSKDIESAVEHVVLDTLGIGVGSYLGGTLGLRLGQGLAPATGGASLVIIPAITTILGSLIGIITGKGIVRTFKERHLRRAYKVLTNESMTFSKQYRKHHKPLLLTIKSKYDQNEDKMDEAISNNQNWFMKVFFPNVVTKFSSKAKANSWKEYSKIKTYLNDLLHIVKKRKKKEKQEAGLILYEQGKNIFFGYEPLIECWEKVDEAFKNFKIEKEKLSQDDLAAVK